MANKTKWQQCISLGLVLVLAGILFCGGSQPVLAGLMDDRYDGNIFALYGGNGSLVPPRVTLAQSLQRSQPTLLIFYINDSSDCKQFTTVVSQLQAFYGRVADFIPVDVDAIPPQSSYNPNEPGYYYQGLVPQTVLLDGSGKIQFNQAGNISFETIDDSMREVFNLLPRSESVDLKPRPLNEINMELSRHP